MVVAGREVGQGGGDLVEITGRGRAMEEGESGKVQLVLRADFSVHPSTRRMECLLQAGRYT